MKILKSVLEETLNKIGGYKDKEHSIMSFIINKGVLTMLVRNETDYAMRKLADIEGIDEIESFSVDVSELMYVLNFSDSDVIDLKFVDNKVQILSGIISVKVNKGEVLKVTRVKSDNIVNFTFNTDTFVQSIVLASNAIDVDSTFKGCVGVEVKDKKATIQALDGTAGIFDYINIDADKDFALHIPKEKIQLFRGMEGQYKGVYDIDNQVFVATNSEYMFSVKLKDFKFNNFRTQLQYGNGLTEIFENSDVVLDITKEELSKCVNLFKNIKNKPVYAKFENNTNKYTLTCDDVDRTVMIELKGNAMIKEEAHMFSFDFNKIKWIQHLKEDKIFVFFKKFVSGNSPVFNKIVPYSSTEGKFDDISVRKVGLFLPVQSDEVNSFYKGLENGETPEDKMENTQEQQNDSIEEEEQEQKEEDYCEEE